ncbi:hypothetical protein C0995_013957 [Termitomyces sp. Mi166|nr:hypothetical protein C0995_013957 [Termitomyces sp. Mi166\
MGDQYSDASFHASTRESEAQFEIVPTSPPGVPPKYNWTYPALATIIREEGVAALYKGFVPKVLRLAPGGGVLLLVVEFTLGIFRQVLGLPYI